MGVENKLLKKIRQNIIEVIQYLRMVMEIESKGDNQDRAYDLRQNIKKLEEQVDFMNMMIQE